MGACVSSSPGVVPVDGPEAASNTSKSLDNSPRAEGASSCPPAPCRTAELDSAGVPAVPGGPEPSTTRARRLSMSTEARPMPGSPTKGSPTNKGSPTKGSPTKAHVVRPASPAKPPPHVDVLATAAPPPEGAHKLRQNNTGTRVRRLSYVTNDKDLAEKIRGEYGMPCEEDPEPSLQPPTVRSQGHAPAQQRTIQLQVACMSRAGREPGYKKTNQDSCFAFEKYISEDQSLFGAMDGHGPNGHHVSGFVKQHLPILLVEHLTSSAGDVAASDAVSAAFWEVDEALAKSQVDCEFSGCTCVVAHLKGSVLTASWVGDSRCVVGRRTRSGWEAVELTRDHKPTVESERARILQARGRVERLVDELGMPIGPHRVWLEQAWVPGLAMSRALGDHVAQTVGVIPDPEHTVRELRSNDRFLLLASDGVWEFVSSQEAVELVAAHATPEDACRALVEESFQRWLTEEEGVVDDITVVVVALTPGGGSARASLSATAAAAAAEAARS